MVKKINKLGVFTITTILIFALSTILNIHHVTSCFRSYRIEDLSITIVIRPRVIEVFAWIAFLFWILRVYLHFIGVEASLLMREKVLPLIERFSPPKAHFEIIIRMILICGVSLFPSLCRLIRPDSMIPQDTFFRFYFFGLSGLLFMWDYGMYVYIIRNMVKVNSGSVDSIKFFAKWLWFWCDFAIWIIFAVMAFLTPALNNFLKPLVHMSLLSFLIIGVLLQVVSWTPKIFKEIKTL